MATGEVNSGGLIGRFAAHPLAANLSMAIMVFAGVWATFQLNKQFLPDFSIGQVTVSVAWSGAGAGDVESGIAAPLEQALRSVDLVQSVTSTSVPGRAVVTLMFKNEADMNLAVEQVRQEVALVSDLPPTAEMPVVTRAVDYDNVARVILSGQSLRDLALLAREYERELLARGISKIRMSGLPSEEIAIQVPQIKLNELGLSLVDIGQAVARNSQDLPAGAAGRGEGARQIRFLSQRRDEIAFEQMPFTSDADGRELRIGDVAAVTRRARTGQVLLRHEGRPAIEMSLLRTEAADSLQAAKVLAAWVADTRPRLPQGVSLSLASEDWKFLQQRIALLVKNGAGGLVLVMLILFLFMPGRIAAWIAVGIPVSFLGMLCVHYFLGGSINMVSMFAMIMAIGIIVDDAIVVGENALARREAGADALTAAVRGARSMLPPVAASSGTTIAAFLPLFLVTGTVGSIVGAIPTVVVCVIIASLVECFLILPGHLHHTLRKSPAHAAVAAGRLRRRLDGGFKHVRERWFRPLVSAAVDNPWATVSFNFAMILVAFGLVAGGLVKFEFFPTPEGRVVSASVGFVPGTPRRVVADYLGGMKQALDEVEQELGGGEKLISTALIREGSTTNFEDTLSIDNEQIGEVWVEFTSPDSRSVRNQHIIDEWRARLPEAPGLERLTVIEEEGGPPGADIDVQLSGDDSVNLKAAAESLVQQLAALPGVGGLSDNMPYGREQLVLELTPIGRALGLTVEDIGLQLRAAYDGYVAQTFTEGIDNVEVRVVLPDGERNYLASLDTFSVSLPGGGAAPLSTVASYRARRGFDSIVHKDGKLSVNITGSVNAAVANANEIERDMEEVMLPQLARDFDVEFGFGEATEEEAEALDDMARGALFALVLIYLVLAWVFSSYGWPLLVMAIIPLGLVGAIWGHFWMGLDLTILSLFGFFGLSGIVVNDSIILVVFYRKLREQGVAMKAAVTEAACQRLRAVLLTSLTTIGGLLPLLFETSLQAQFLIPMAATIAFGLAFATVIVLLMIPALLCLYESAAGRK